MLGLAGADPSRAQTPPGTIITNTATADFTDAGGNPVARASNVDQIVVAVSRTPSTLEFLKYGPGVPGSTPTAVGPQTCSTSGTAAGPFIPSPGMTDLSGASIDLGMPVPLISDGAYHAGEPVFLRLVDPDQNLDPAAAETVDLELRSDSGDLETLRLSENGPDTGVFIGYIMSANPPPVVGDCVISVSVDESVTADYVDVADGGDTSSDTTLVDPYGLVFDSTTGQPVDGAEVTLWDVLAGAPASVIGDDGFASFPSTITTGGSATDSGGTVYDFSPGRYRFPFVMPGQYELRVVPPASHAHPTAASDGALQALPGSPFAIMLGSRGEPFSVPVGPAVRVDIPLDPLGGELLVTKQAMKEEIGEGEFLAYRVRVTNSSAVTIVGATLIDRLPRRFRYERGSARRAGARLPDPEIGRGGRELRVDLGDLAAGASQEIEYVIRVATGARPGEHVNRAFVETAGGAVSNLAEARVRVVQDLFDQRAFLVGRIHVDACDAPLDRPADGLAGVRVYMEDGSFVVTDEEGRFHFEAISPGMHVVQMDLDSLPPGFEAVDCGLDNRRAGRAFSEFVDVQPGTLWRTDFHVRRKPAEIGALVQKLEATPAAELIEYRLDVTAERFAADQVVAMIRLPDDALLDLDSVTQDGASVEATFESGTLLVPLGQVAGDETRVVRFRVRPTDAAAGPFEARSIVRARTSGRPATTPPALVRVSWDPPPEPTPERVADPAPTPTPTPAPIVMPEALPPLDHRLLHRVQKGLVHYVLQVFVDDTLPEVIVAEVELPENERFLDWTPRNERGKSVTSVRTGQKVRFVVPRDSSSGAVRVFLVGGVPKKAIQIFFIAQPTGARSAVAESRVLTNYERLPAAPAPILDRPQIDGIDGSAGRATSSDGPRRRASALAEPAATPRAARPVLDPESMPIPTAVSQVELAAAEGAQEVEPEAPRPEKTRPAQLAPPEQRFGADWLATAPVGRDFVYPAEGALPRIPSLKLGIQHEPGVKVELLRNDEPVSALHFDGRAQNVEKTVALSRWRGVGLEEGPNRFVAIFRDAAGNEVDRRERIVHLAGSPVRARVVKEHSLLVADGRTTPIVALRLTDRWGEPVREGSTGQFDLDPPHQTEEEVLAQRDRPLAGLGFERPSFVVEEEGIARIRLHPTSVVGEARLRFQLREEREEEVTAWLEPGDRDWVLVGLATSTIGWNHESGGGESRRADEAGEGFYEEGRVAFFAKGRIPGRFLLTAAYDSKADDTRLRDRLFQTIEPDETYTLYGDTTQADLDAPTSNKVFVKIERERFFALYGDYQTGLEDTELSRYSRRLTGAKLEYRGDRFEAKGFLTDSDQSFVKDEILGDGTSGLYRLSRQDIVPGSDALVLETRDRFRPELVVASEPMSRFTDYEIDYSEGTLFFRKPIPSQDGSFNPIFIVVDYETNDRRANAISGGGRVAGRALEGRVELGFTGIHQDGGEVDSQLLGADTTIEIADDTLLRGEFAHTRSNGFDGRESGDAWLVELDHRGESLELRAYAEEQAESFGLGQQIRTASSLRSYGLDLGYDVTKAVRVESSVFRQENLSTDGKRNVAELGSRWESGRFGLNAGARYVGDDAPERDHKDSVQLIGGARADFFDGRFSLRAEGETAITEDEYGEYPHRVLAGADLKLHERLTLFADQELTFGDEQTTADTRAGFRGAPWKGATISTSVTEETREYGPRTYANLGLQQRWDVSPSWGFDLSVDRVATIRDPGNQPFKVGNPAPSGSFSDDFTAVSIGAAYRREGWSGTGRLETRFGEQEDRWGFVAGLLRDANEDLSWSARVDLFYTNARSGTKELRSDSSFSLAYRPLRSRWIVLERLDFDYRDQSGDGFDFESRKLLHHLKANQMFGRRTQLSWQLSNKLVVDTIDGRRYSNFGTLVGVEVRKDLAPGWDMSMHGRVRHQTGGDEVGVGYGLSVGRILVENVWLSFGYNLVGFYDEEFSAADYTAQGPYFRIRAKFDQLSVKEALDLFR